MELILLSKNRGHVAHLWLTSRRVWLGFAGLGLLTCAGVFYGGFQAATYFSIANPVHQAAAWRADLAEQELIVAATQQVARYNLDALALRLGQMNAHVVRLDALGQRLTQMAGLDDGEFDFAAAPSLGGPEELVSMADLVRRIRGMMGRPPRLFPVPAAMLRCGLVLAGRGGAADRLLSSLRVDDSRIENELHWSPPFSMADGLAATIAWYRGRERVG